MSTEGRPTGRLPWFLPSDLTPDQRELYDAITTGPRGGVKRAAPLTDESGRLEGPFNSMLVSPGVGTALQALGASIRWKTSMSSREREIATLLAAVHETSDFEWVAHEFLGRAAGLTDDDLVAIARREAGVSFDPRERVVVTVVNALVDQRDLGDDLFAEAVAVLGTALVVELVTLVGYYQLLSLSLRVYRVPLPVGIPSPFDGDAASGTA